MAVECESCGGLNTSCPDGCERDPETGELVSLLDVKSDDVVVGEFIARWDEAVDGVCMDVDTAQALARELKRLRTPLNDLAQVRLYLECHITCEASPAYDFLYFSDLASLKDWRASRFSEDEVDGYHGQWFLSFRSHSFPDAKLKVLIMRDYMIANGFNVLRWKIEDTLLDSKYGDEL